MKESGEKPLRQFSPVHQGHSKDESKEPAVRPPPRSAGAIALPHGRALLYNHPSPWAPPGLYRNCNSLAPPPPPRCRVPSLLLRCPNKDTWRSLIVFRHWPTPVRASYCGNIFGVKSFQSMYYLPDSCMNVRILLLWLLVSVDTAAHFQVTTVWKLCV